MKQFIILSLSVFILLTEVIIPQYENKVNKPIQPGELIQKSEPGYRGIDFNENNPENYLQQERILKNTIEVTDEYLIEEQIYQTWDVSIWKNSTRYFVTYTPDGQALVATSQIWDGTLWLNTYRYEYEYNGNNQQTSMTGYTWDASQWVNYSKIQYEYDANGYQDIVTEYLWDGFIWVNEEKIYYDYNSNGNIIEIIYQIWTGGIWVNDDRVEYEYDVNYYHRVSLHQTWNGATWENVTQYLINYYAANNQISSYRNQDWNGASWVNDWLYLYNYDSNNLLVEFYHQVWTGSLWGNNYRYLYEYNGSNIISTIVELWSANQWVNSQRIIITWNNGVQVNNLNQVWNGSGWVNSSQGIFVYDSNNNCIIETYQFWNGTQWVNQSRYLKSYILILTDIDDHPGNISDYGLSQNYPNPFNPSTSIEYRVGSKEYVLLKVYDILGNDVATLVNEEKNSGVYNVTFEADGLSSGVYFYKLTAGEFTDTKKFLLLK